MNDRYAKLEIIMNSIIVAIIIMITAIFMLSNDEEITQSNKIDKNKKLVPIGVTGELYISGDNVSKGYLNNEELTKKAFVPLDDLNISYAYRTGDLVKWDNNGIINAIVVKNENNSEMYDMYIGAKGKIIHYIYI